MLGTIWGWKLQDSEEQKQKFRDDPEYYRKYIKDIEASLSVPMAILKNTPTNEFAREVCTVTNKASSQITTKSTIRYWLVWLAVCHDGNETEPAGETGSIEGFDTNYFLCGM